jgi:ADP-heptose:LPS heptosyltransferase
VMPKLILKSVASVINKTSGVVVVDTGRGVLAAAADKPTVSLYGLARSKLMADLC